MPELHKILGSLFSDIAQSVFTSDLYSREISRYYEQDGLLRHFPVPRTEVSELEIDLKFAISNINVNLNQGIEREAYSAPILIEFSFDVSENFFEELQNILPERLKHLKPKSMANTEELEKEIEQVLHRAASGARPIYMRQDLLKFFQRNRGCLIEMVDGEEIFQQKMIQNELQEILRKHASNVLGKPLAGQVEDVLKEVLKNINLDAKINALEEPLRFSKERASDYKMDIDIDAAKLEELDREKLSSVRVRTHVRNYKWTEIDHDGPEPWYTLNPE